MLITYLSEEDIFMLSNIYNKNNIDNKTINKDEITEYITKLENPTDNELEPKKNLYSALQKINTTSTEIINDIKQNTTKTNKEFIFSLKKIDK